jgi:hypothetical protein
MHKSLLVIPMLFAATVLRANITYTINFGTSYVTGTITTDGTIGTLDSANILSWNLMVDDQVDGFTAVTSTDSDIVAVFGSGLTATATNLSFAFSAPEVTYLNFEDTVTDYNLCYLEGALCTSFGGEEGIEVINDANDNNIGVFESGTQVIASVPEPCTVTLVLTGIGLSALATVRRNKRPSGQ